MSEIARFNAVLDYVPDTVAYKFFNENGMLAHSGSSSEVEGTQNARGYRLSVTYDWPDTLAAGEYTVEFEVPDTTVTHSVNQTVVAPATRIPDVVTLDGYLQLDNVPMTNGTWRLFRVNEEVGAGVFSNSAIPRVALGTHPSLDSLSLVLMNSDMAIIDLEVYYISPSILKAIKELRERVDRLNRELRLSILEFTDSDYLRWLVAGRDRFNAVPIATDFSMTAATGPIRDFWITAAMVTALRVRYLEEGLSAYSYQGASISLDVDVTQYLETMAASLEERLRDEAPRMKTNMHQRGLTAGPGTWSLRNNAIGALGLTTGPVSGRGGYGRPR